MQARSVVLLEEIRLPEFDKNRVVLRQRALIFDNKDCQYDIILGTDFLAQTGIKIDYETGTMSWFDNTLPMRPPHGLDTSEFVAMEDHYCLQLEDELLGEHWLDCFATSILDAKYEWTDITKVVNDLEHLN